MSWNYYWSESAGSSWAQYMRSMDIVKAPGVSFADWWVIHSGCRFCCSHSRQADRDLAMNLTLPLRSITSHFWSA